MKSKRTFRVHAKSDRARKKLMNFTGTGAGDIALKKKEEGEKAAAVGGALRSLGGGMRQMFTAPIRLPSAFRNLRAAGDELSAIKRALKMKLRGVNPVRDLSNPFAPPLSRAENLLRGNTEGTLRYLMTSAVQDRSRLRRQLLTELVGSAGAASAAATPFVYGRLFSKNSSVKTAQDPPQRGYWERFGRSAVGLYDDPTAAQMWQQQAQAWAQEIAQQQGIPAQQALPIALQQMRDSGLTPQTLQQQALETDISDRTLLTGQVKHWLNPVFNPVLNPGYIAAQSALEAGDVGRGALGEYAPIFQGLAPMGMSAGMAGLGKLGVPGMSLGSKAFGSIGSGAAKYLLPIYMGARTAVDPQGIRGIAENLWTGKAPTEFNRIMQAQAMRDVQGGKPIKDTFGDEAHQLASAGLRPLQYLHDLLPLGDLAAAGSNKLFGTKFDMPSQSMQSAVTKGQQFGERAAIRGDLNLSDFIGPAAGLGIPFKLWSKSMGNVSGYDPFYRQRWAANRMARRLDEQRRRGYRDQLQQATTPYGGTDPEAQSSQLWLSQMKRMGELDPFGSKGTWTRDMITQSYKPTDEDQTEVDPSQSVWRRSLADAQQIAKERGMTVSQVLRGRDARAAASDQQRAKDFLLKAKAVESGNVEGMDPGEVARIRNFVANTKAQGNPIDEQAAMGFVMQRRRQSDIAGAHAAGEKPGYLDEGRHGGYDWWRNQLAEGKGYSPYESLSAKADVGKGFDRGLFDQLYDDEVVKQIKGTRGYSHAMGGIKGGFSQAQMEQFLADKDPYELQKLYGMNARTMRELHQVNRQDYVDAMNLANRRLATGAGRGVNPTPPKAPAKIPSTPGTGTYLPDAKKKDTGGGVAAAPQNASGKGDGSRV